MMVIYGVMILGLCMFVGTAIGLALGKLLGIPGDIGGVGFAMLILVFATKWLKDNQMLPKPTEDGIQFWNAMYIPVVIAMASTQNVIAALTGGPMATLAGLGAVFAGFALIRPLSAMCGATSFDESDGASPSKRASAARPAKA